MYYRRLAHVDLKYNIHICRIASSGFQLCSRTEILDSLDLKFIADVHYRSFHYIY